MIAESGGPLKVALYARVSTDDKNQDPETQLMPLRDFAQRQEWEVYDEYVDEASAGDFGRRHRWNTLLLLASQKHFDIILVNSLDRAFRSVLDGATTLENLRAWRVGFRSYREPMIDTTNPIGEALFYFTAAWAQLEKRLISVRVTEGMARAKAQGIHVGRPRVIDFVDVNLIIELRSHGKSWRDIAREHPEVELPGGQKVRPSHETVRKVIEGERGTKAA